MLLALLSGESVFGSLLRRSGLTVYGQPIPDEIWLATFVFGVVILLAFIASRALSVERPGGIQQVTELSVGGFVGLMEDTIPHHARRHLPVIGTFAVFILVSNLLGMVPGFGSPTASANVTLALALVSFTYYNIAALREVGPVAHVKHFLGPVAALAILIGPIEIFSHFARNLSLSMRLFGNIFGEHQATGIFQGFFGGWLIPLPMMVLGLFGAFLQTFIFCLLSMIYIALATEHSDH